MHTKRVRRDQSTAIDRATGDCWTFEVTNLRQLIAPPEIAGLSKDQSPAIYGATGDCRTFEGTNLRQLTAPPEIAGLSKDQSTAIYGATKDCRRDQSTAIYGATGLRRGLSCSRYRVQGPGSIGFPRHNRKVKNKAQSSWRWECYVSVHSSASVAAVGPSTVKTGNQPIRLA